MGRWEQGLPLLSQLVDSDRTGERLPGIVYSYFGYGLARFRGNAREGLHFCQQAIRLEFYEPDNYLNLARVQLVLGDRAGAVLAIRRGLAVDPEHVALADLHANMGVRRPPVIRALSRANPLNRALGKLRHVLLRPIAFAPTKRATAV